MLYNDVLLIKISHTERKHSLYDIHSFQVYTLCKKLLTGFMAGEISKKWMCWGKIWKGKRRKFHRIFLSYKINKSSKCTIYTPDLIWLQLIELLCHVDWFPCLDLVTSRNQFLTNTGHKTVLPRKIPKYCSVLLLKGELTHYIILYMW